MLVLLSWSECQSVKSWQDLQCTAVRDEWAKNHQKRGILQRVILESHGNHANRVEENDSLVE